jgi:hypothetical protein
MNSLIFSALDLSGISRWGQDGPWRVSVPTPSPPPRHRCNTSFQVQHFRNTSPREQHRSVLATPFCLYMDLEQKYRFVRRLRYHLSHPYNLCGSGSPALLTILVIYTNSEEL